MIHMLIIFSNSLCFFNSFFLFFLCQRINKLSRSCEGSMKFYQEIMYWWIRFFIEELNYNEHVDVFILVLMLVLKEIPFELMKVLEWIEFNLNYLNLELSFEYDGYNYHLFLIEFYLLTQWFILYFELC